MDENTLLNDNEKTSLQDRIDFFHFNNRVIFLDSEIDDVTTSNIIKQIKALEITNPEKGICIIINSPGGCAYNAIALYDVIRASSCSITTIGVGKVFSASIWILISGTGDRMVYKNTRLMIHEGSETMFDNEKISDLQIRSEEAQKWFDTYLRILKKHTKIDKSYKELRLWLKEDRYFSPLLAKEMGIVDEIIPTRKKSIKRTKKDEDK